jgi:guanine nucleotide-binding protein subunit alpha
VLEYMDTTDIAFASPSSTAHSHVVTDHPRTASDQEEAAVQETLDAIADLWSDAHVRDVALNRSAEYQLSDSATFFFDSIHRFSQPDYLPTDDDILRARVRTTGITESHFDLGTMSLRLMDVGEQRSERRKWVHWCAQAMDASGWRLTCCSFEDVTAIILCARRIGVAYRADALQLYRSERIRPDVARG